MIYQGEIVKNPKMVPGMSTLETTGEYCSQTADASAVQLYCRLHLLCSQKKFKFKKEENPNSRCFLCLCNLHLTTQTLSILYEKH